MRATHTADLDAATLDAVRALLDDAFGGAFGDHDWDHALGGVHVLAWDDKSLVGHAAVVQRRLLHRGRALRCGYVEGVGVRADARRRGVATTMMAAVERVILGAYELGALSSTDDAAPLYVRRGWQRWDGPLSALTPAGVAPTVADEGSVYVLPAGSALDTSAELACDWRDGDLW